MIPPITNELGRYWEQPDPAGILVDDTHAVMSAADYERLREYSTSIPSGVYDGKMWKRRERDEGGWIDSYLLCWYGPDPEPDVCRIETRKILVV